jgi:hypothetical protein
MHHAPLNGPWPHDGDLDDQIVKVLRQEARQHRHLRPTLDLKDPHRVRTTERCVHLRVFRRNPGKQIVRVEEVFVPRDYELQGFADGREHAEAQDVDLEHAELVDVVLVPGDHRAVLHRRGLDGSDRLERVRGQDESAHVNRQMPRVTLNRSGHLQTLPHAAVVRVEARVT